MTLIVYFATLVDYKNIILFLYFKEPRILKEFSVSRIEVKVENKHFIQ